MTSSYLRRLLKRIAITASIQLTSFKVAQRGVVQFAIFGNYRHKMTLAGFEVVKESKDIDAFWYHYCKKKICYVVGRNVQQMSSVGKGPLLIILQALAPWGPMRLQSWKTKSKYISRKRHCQCYQAKTVSSYALYYYSHLSSAASTVQILFTAKFVKTFKISVAASPLVNRCYGTWTSLAYCCHYPAKNFSYNALTNHTALCIVVSLPLDNFNNFFQWNCELISVWNNPVCHVVFWASGRPGVNVNGFLIF